MPEIDLKQAKCREYPSEARLWDAEIDGNLKNAVAENSAQRHARHEKAKKICQGCSQKSVCYLVGRNDTMRTGIYGGELV